MSELTAARLRVMAKELRKYAFHLDFIADQLSKEEKK